MIFSSKLIEDAVDAFGSLPGVGRKTALRMVLHLLKKDKSTVDSFAAAITNMREQINYCEVCHNIADGNRCSICKDSSRDHLTICVVENIRDIISIESTRQYKGVYHVLGGLLSPLDGVGPEQLTIESLKIRLENASLSELIMALSPTIEGDTTVYYISKQFIDKSIKITSIARGISFGGELEYTDEVTLGRSITKRLPVDNYVNVSIQEN